jgi:hypothetical protein
LPRLSSSVSNCSSRSSSSSSSSVTTTHSAAKPPMLAREGAEAREGLAVVVGLESRGRSSGFRGAILAGAASG